MGGSGGLDLRDGEVGAGVSVMEEPRPPGWEVGGRACRSQGWEGVESTGMEWGVGGVWRVWNYVRQCKT
jgi:hypothetical protein